jgi:malonate decarboxylase epsilon subunit
MKTVMTFPGQGAQKLGMLSDLPDSAKALGRIKEAQDILGCPLDELDTAKAFEHTQSVQLALLISGVIWAEHVQDQIGQPDYVMGLSIGAFPAAVIANSLRFDDALKLVCLRGELMQSAYPQGYGMTALMNVDRTCLDQAIESAHQRELPVHLANLNGHHQYVIAGSQPAMRFVVQQLQAMGSCSAKALSVSVPSHCDLLAREADQLTRAFQGVVVQKPECGFVSASITRVTQNAEGVRQELEGNMAKQVHWGESCQLLAERGVETVLEMPPGSTNTALFRRALPNGRCIAISDLKPGQDIF